MAFPCGPQAAKSKYHTVVAEAARRAGRVDMAEQHAEQAGRKSGAAGKNQKKGLAGKLQRSLRTRQGFETSQRKFTW